MERCVSLMENKRRDGLFLAVVTLFWFAQYIFVPFLTPHLAAMGVAASISGVILGAYGFSQLILRIPVSVSEDCLGRHRLYMSCGLGAVVVASALPALFDSPAAYLLSRTLAGVGASTWVSFTVAFTGGYPNVKERMGRLVACNNLGILLSYLVSGVLYQRLGMKPLFVISSVVAAGALLVLPLCQKGGSAGTHPFRLSELWTVLKNKHLLTCSLMCALMQLINFATAMSFVSTYAQQRGASGFALSLVAIAFYVAGTTASAVYGRGVFSRLSDRTFMAMGFGTFALYCLVLPLCQNVWLILLAQLVGGVSRTLLYTQQMALCTQTVAPEHKTTAVGVFQSIYSLGMTVGPVVMGWVLELTANDYPTAFVCISAFAVAGVIWSLLALPREKA